MTQACAAIVERDDPHLYATALFAPEPARSRLMVLYAFDCELSRAIRSSKESMIPRMRLQWWRDVVEEAAEGKPAKSHEVAAPLHGLIRDCEALRDSQDLLVMIDAHGAVLNLPWTSEQEPLWRVERFQRLVSSACKLLTDAADDPPMVATVLADAFALRHAHRMAASGENVLLTGVAGSDLAALARGDLSEALKERAQGVAGQALERLKQARSQRSSTDPRFMPVLLPLLWAERVLVMVRRDPTVLLGQLDSIDRPFDGLKLAFRAARGRW